MINDTIVALNDTFLALDSAAMLPQARPYQCQWHEGCTKSFNRKSDLQRHYRIHTNERPYACDFADCRKTFIQRSALTVHRRTHTGDKPHKCPFSGCGKCFSDSSSLARHRRIHTNDKPYICKNARCRKAFCRKTTMTKHFFKEHPNDDTVLSANELDEELDYSEGEQSEEEQISSLQEGRGSPESVDALSDEMVASQSSHASSNNYSASLWRLPAVMAQQRPEADALLARSGSQIDLPSAPAAKHPRLSHRAMTDPNLAHALTSSAFANMRDVKAMPNQDNELQLWQALNEASTMNSAMPEQAQFHRASMPSAGSQSAGYNHTNKTLPLQLVHEIVLDETSPQSHPHVTSADRPGTSGFNAMSHQQQRQQHQRQQRPQQIQSTGYTTSTSSTDFGDSVPPTPSTQQHLHDFANPATANPTVATNANNHMSFQGATYHVPHGRDEFAMQVPMPGNFNAGSQPMVQAPVPVLGSTPVYNPAMNLLKDFKMGVDEPWNQMPGAVVGWNM